MSVLSLCCHCDALQLCCIATVLHLQLWCIQDIGNLLWEWRSLLGAASLIVVHAPSANESAVFDTATARGGASGAPREHRSPLLRSDPRVCSPPFLYAGLRTRRRAAWRSAWRSSSGAPWRTSGVPQHRQHSQHSQHRQHKHQLAAQAPGSLLCQSPRDWKNGKGWRGQLRGGTEGVRGALGELSLEEAEAEDSSLPHSGAESVQLELHTASAAGKLMVYPGCTQGVPRVYPGCTQGVPMVYQGVPMVYPGCTYGVPRVYLWCTRVYLWCTQGVPMVYQGVPGLMPVVAARHFAFACAR